MLNTIQTKKESLAEKAADQIVQLIKEQEYHPGDRIPAEMEMAQMLNVGRSTVREAVKLLVSRNVLIVQRGRGTFVAKHPGRVDDPLGLQYMTNKKQLYADLLSVRLVLEPWMASEAARYATDEDIAEIQARRIAVEEKIKAGIPHIQEDIKFHTAIARSTRNSVMPLLIPIINRSVNLFGELTQNALTEETIVTHRQIADAIARHEPEAAAAAMRLHIIMNRDNIDKLEIPDE